MYRLIAFLPFFILSQIDVLAQEDGDWRLYRRSDQARDLENPVRIVNTAEASAGQVKVQADHRILEMDSLRKEHPSAMEGYRVQVFFGNRNDAQKLRGDFLRKHPDIGAYVSYLAPNFRLRVGDFRTKIECEKFKRDLLSDFPGSYIVKDQINMPPLRKAETE